MKKSMATLTSLVFSVMLVSGCMEENSGDEHFLTDSTSYPDYTGADTLSDHFYPAEDATGPDAPPDVPLADAEESDVEEEEIEINVCDFPVEEPQILYLSADDSNSQASPIIARWMINNGRTVPWYVVRTYEFLNYYSLSYEPPAQGRVTVTAQMRPDPDEEALYNMQIGVQSNIVDMEERRPLSITFSLDTSGSMGGGPIDRLRHVCRAIAANLKAGDIVSMVKWNTSQAVLLESYEVTGPDDSHLLDRIDSLDSDGGTNLQAGLAEAYRLAGENYRDGWLNRVVLISDGQANAGITDEDLIARHADDSEREGIYLVGVGTGEGFNDRLMDVITDAGKGAYIFIDTEEEASKMFVERFLASMEIAVMDVKVQLTLPPVLRMEIFFGEEYSENPKEVEPQHLAPNDAMIFQQTLRSCWEITDEDMIKAVATYIDPSTKEHRSDSFEASALTIMEGAAEQLKKGYAIIRYAEALKEIDQTSDSSERQQICNDAKSKVDQAAGELDDDELREISGLLEIYCPLFS